MPEMTPVADKIIPPDPQKGMALMSSILGIRQQRQNLQTGAIEQGTARSIAQQQNLEAQQKQGLQDFLKGFDFTSHLDTDGTPSLDSILQSDDFKKANGNSKPAILQTLLDIKQKSLGNKTALAGLNSELVKQFGTSTGALATDPDVKADQTDPVSGVNAGRAKAEQAVSNFAKLSPDAARVAAIYAPAIQHAPQGKLAGTLRMFQLQAQDASAQQAQQNPGQMAVNTGGAQQIFNVDKATGLQPGQPPAQSIQNVTPPANYTNAAGQLVHAPAGGAGLPQMGQPTAPPQGPSGVPQRPPIGGLGPNPTTAQAASQAAAVAGVTSRVEQAKAASNQTVQAQDALTRALSIVDSPNAPNTGAGAGNVRTFKNFLSTIGIDTGGAEDMNSLVKNLARYEAQRATQSGLGGTDAARELAHNGSPSTQLDNKALRDIITQSLATEKALSAYANVQSKTTDPNQMLANETAFRGIPRLIEGYEYGLAKNKAEADAFLKKHGMTSADMALVRKQIRQFEAQ